MDEAEEAFKAQAAVAVAGARRRWEEGKKEPAANAKCQMAAKLGKGASEKAPHFQITGKTGAKLSRLRSNHLRISRLQRHHL